MKQLSTLVLILFLAINLQAKTSPRTATKDKIKHYSSLFYAPISYFNSQLNFGSESEKKNVSSYKMGLNHSIFHKQSQYFLQYESFRTNSGNTLKENYILSYKEKKFNKLESFAGLHLIDTTEKNRDEDIFAFLGVSYLFQDQEKKDHAAVSLNLAYGELKDFMGLGIKTASFDIQPRLKTELDLKSLPGIIGFDFAINFKLFSRAPENVYKKFYPAIEQNLNYTLQNWQFSLFYWTSLSEKGIMYPVFDKGYTVFSNGDSFHRKAQVSIQYQIPSNSVIGLSYRYHEMNELLYTAESIAFLSKELTAFTEIQLTLSKYF